MAWSFRRRIKIIPGVHLNLSRSGISTSVGVPGVNFTIGKQGTYLNTGIPGTGIYHRQKLKPKDEVNNNSDEYKEVFQTEQSDNIFSADIQDITSQDMHGIKEAIFNANEQRRQLRLDVVRIKASLVGSWIKQGVSIFLIFGLVNKKLKQALRNEVSAKLYAINKLKEQIERSYVLLDIEFEPEIKEKYDRLITSFKKLCTSKKIWDVTSVQSVNRYSTRSAASTAVKHKEVKFLVKGIEDIKSDLEVLKFNNANGADLYFYPAFIVMYTDKKRFGLISYSELNFGHSSTDFIESGKIPSDSKIIGSTWAKVNKNGSQDKRFKGNYKIPIARYGEISLSTDTGLREKYQFSNYEFTDEFALAFTDYQKTIGPLNFIDGSHFV